MQVNAILSATGTGSQAGKKINTTISHLRQSQESKATQLAQALNRLTTNTYVSTQVNEIGVTDFTPAKSEPTITLAEKLRLNSGIYYLDIISSDIPIANLTLVGKYTITNETKAVYTEASTAGTPEGAIGTFTYLAESNYLNSTGKKAYIIAEETEEYTALYQEVNLKI